MPQSKIKRFEFIFLALITDLKSIFSTIFSLLLEQQTFIYKGEVHNHDTRSTNNFHLPITNLTKYQKGAHYARIKIFNHLPTHIKHAANEIQIFQSALKTFLLSNSFYSIEEYFNSNK